MKRALVLSIAVMVALSMTAFAWGPTLGVGFVPDTGSPAALTVGFDFGPVAIEGSKDDLTTPYGLWTFGMLWTPQMNGFGYRVGPRLDLKWRQSDKTIKYQDLAFVLGMTRTWGPIRLYGEVELTAGAALKAIPTVGIIIIFADLIPDAKAPSP